MLNFDFVLLHVADPLVSADFYSGLLGKPVVESSPGFAMLPLNDKVMLGLWLASDAAPGGGGRPGASEISFDVADGAALSEIHADWTGKGLPILIEPVEMPFGRTFVAADPDGHRIRVVAGVKS
ncbi:VOC family protein [Hoeflea alexandrii]|jgi:catechol 2,3-dioxygenase-like lactoylglutathione lyase family enzyme|uniref:VOC family protein n=1 Tax=Hoeflea alexandrii TaxID=288436 RepID=UPI0035CF7F2E